MSPAWIDGGGRLFNVEATELCLFSPRQPVKGHTRDGMRRQRNPFHLCLRTITGWNVNGNRPHCAAIDEGARTFLNAVTKLSAFCQNVWNWHADRPEAVPVYLICGYSPGNLKVWNEPSALSEGRAVGGSHPPLFPFRAPKRAPSP